MKTHRVKACVLARSWCFFLKANLQQTAETPCEQTTDASLGHENTAVESVVKQQIKAPPPSSPPHRHFCKEVSSVPAYDLITLLCLFFGPTWHILLHPETLVHVSRLPPEGSEGTSVGFKSGSIQLGVWFVLLCGNDGLRRERERITFPVVTASLRTCWLITAGVWTLRGYYQPLLLPPPVLLWHWLLCLNDFVVPADRI